jgi:TFIIF-interacting CTD phosphatase-like protein
LKDLIIVDNSIISFAFNLANGVPIKAFVGEGNDEELLYMVTFLEEIFSIQDVRGHIEKTFKLKSMMQKYGKGKIKGSEKKAIM